MIDEVEKGAGRRRVRRQATAACRPAVRHVAHLAVRPHQRRVRRLHGNDISKLPPEFSRAERFDGIFFLDTPGTAEKEKIWPIHSAATAWRRPERTRPDDRDWTGRKSNRAAGWRRCWTCR